MSSVIEFRGVTKRYGRTVALDGVTLEVPRQSIVGLVGRNGSGKTTLLRHVTGQVLPDAGECITLGVPAARLGASELARMGAVQQHDPHIEWMRGEQLLRYVSSFYATWDRDLEQRLVRELEVDLATRLSAMSPGNRQKLGLVLATCHRPELLLLDEPLSDLDPVARRAVLALLLERFSSDDVTMIISSHMLRDIEPVVDRILCIHNGAVAAYAPLDELKERYEEWVVTSAAPLPSELQDGAILSTRREGRQARLIVDAHRADAAAFERAHAATVETRPLSLDRIFSLLVEDDVARSVRTTPPGSS